MERWIRATLCSWRGLVAAARSEAAFREELLALALAIPAAFWLTAQPWRRAELIGVVMLVMIAELLNTAVEKLCDRVTRDHDEQIARVKDMGSAAVGLSMLIGFALWLVALVEALAGGR